MSRRNVVVVRAFASQSVDLQFIPLVESYQKTFKMIFRASLLGARYLGEVVENKSASSLVVSWGKALNGMPPPLCGRQVAQFSLRRESWWHKGHTTVKQLPCYKNADYLLWRPVIGKSRKTKKKMITKWSLKRGLPHKKE